MSARIEDVLAEHKANPDPDGGYSVECDHGCGVFVIGVDWEAHVAAKVREWLLSDETVEVMRLAIEDELIEWRDERRFMLCGNGFSVREKDGSPSSIIRFRTDTGLRIGLRAALAAATEAALTGGGS